MLSTYYDEGSKREITLNVWKSKPDNERHFHRLMNLFRAWARANERNDVSCIGIRFELRQDKGETFLPFTITRSMGSTVKLTMFHHNSRRPEAYFQ
jgi:hypothetical protein